MKIGIISCSPRCYSTQRLKEAALARGHKVTVLNTLRFSIDLDQGQPDLYYKSKNLSTYDAVIPRIGALMEFVRVAGIDEAAFTKALTDEEVLATVRADTDAADAAGLKFTPMIFINGQAIDVGK